jgi:hypothetical protein
MQKTRLSINYLLLLVVLAAGFAKAGAAPSERQFEMQPIYLVDLWNLYEREDLNSLNEQVNATYFITALQGIVNREAPRLFLDASLNLMNAELESNHYPDHDPLKDFESLDRRWLEWLQSEKLLQGRPIIELASLRELMDTLGGAAEGLVRWDMETPASVNLALTAAGAENLLPLGVGLDDGVLAGKLTEAGLKLPVMRDFTGFAAQAKQQGVTGKELVYRQMIEHFLKPGKANPSYFWFNLDAYAWKPPVVSYGGNQHLGARNSIQHNGLYNNDYWVAKGGLFVDLYSLDSEPPNDDPEQVPGVDLKLWNDLLEESYRQRDGAFGVMGGFAPWWVKYSNQVGNSYPPIDAEQSFIRLATSYNLWNDADAAFGLSNASFYQHIALPAASEFANPAQPKRELDKDTIYVCLVMLDYDGSAWLNQMAHSIYDQEGRGTVPLNWAINPILGDRVPHVFHYLLSKRTDQDFFRMGDNGAGYIDPYYLKGENRTGRIREDGFEAYNRAAKPYLESMDMDLMAFYISDRAFTIDTLAPIAPLTPAGMGLNRRVPADSVAGVPMEYLKAYHHRENAKFENELERLFRLAQSERSGPKFYAYRLILFRPYMVSGPIERLQAEHPDAKIEFLDAHTFMQLKAEADKLPQPGGFLRR